MARQWTMGSCQSGGPLGPNPDVGSKADIGPWPDVGPWTDIDPWPDVGPWAVVKVSKLAGFVGQ